MDFLSNIWDRLRESSTLLAIGALLAVLAALVPNIVGPEKSGQYEELLEVVDEFVTEGDEISDEALGRYRELRGIVEEEVSWVVATGRGLWNNFTLVIAALFSLLGITLPDFLRPRGVKFVAVSSVLEAHGVDPEDPLRVD